MGIFTFLKELLWVGFIGVNTLLFKTFYELALLPFIAPWIIDTPLMYLTSTIAGIAWAILLYVGFKLKFRSNDES